MEKKKKKDDSKGFDWLIETILLIVFVLVAYFTLPSDAKIKSKIESEVTAVYFNDSTPEIRYDTDNFVVFKITSFCAEKDGRTYIGRAIGVFGFVWVP